MPGDQGAQPPARPQDITLAEGDRWAGAGALAESAGTLDGTYRQLGVWPIQVGNGMENADYRSPQVKAAAARAQAYCAATFH